MLRPETCDISNVNLTNEFRFTLQFNDTIFREYLRAQMPNYTGDWDDAISNTRQYLLNQLIIHSPRTELMTCRAFHFIWLYLPPIIIILGTVGNLLSLSVLCGRSMVHVSSYVYLATLTIVDEIIIISGLLRKWMELLLQRRIDHTNPVVCKLVQVTGVSTSCLSVWLIVALTVERFIVIAFPFQANKYATPVRAKIVITVIAVLCFLVSSHFFTTVDLVPLTDEQQGESNSHVSYMFPLNNLTSNNTTPSTSSSTITSPPLQTYYCQFKPQYKTFGLIWGWLDAGLYSYIPFALITVLNIVICRGVYKARRTRASMVSSGTHMNTSNPPVVSRLKISGGLHSMESVASVGRAQPVSKGSNVSSEATRQLTVMLLVVSFVFLLTTTPIVVSKFIFLSMKTKPSSISSNATLQLVDAVTEMLMYLNHSTNFFLYCAMGQKFRQQLARLWIIKLICGRWNTKDTMGAHPTLYHTNRTMRDNGRTRNESVMLLTSHQMSPNSSNRNNQLTVNNLPRGTLNNAHYLRQQQQHHQQRTHQNSMYKQNFENRCVINR